MGVTQGGKQKISLCCDWVLHDGLMVVSQQETSTVASANSVTLYEMKGA